MSFQAYKRRVFDTKNIEVEDNLRTFFFLQKVDGSTCCSSALPPHTSALVIYVRLPMLFFPFQELGAVSLDGYFHLWKAEHNLCKVNHNT